MAPPAGGDAACQGLCVVLCPLVAAASGRPEENFLVPSPFLCDGPPEFLRNLSLTRACNKWHLCLPNTLSLPFWQFIWGTLVLTLFGLGRGINQGGWSELPLPATSLGRWLKLTNQSSHPLGHSDSFRDGPGIQAGPIKVSSRNDTLRLGERTPSAGAAKLGGCGVLVAVLGGMAAWDWRQYMERVRQNEWIN